MISKVVEHLCSEIHRLNPSFTQVNYVKSVSNLLVDKNGVYGGIRDNKNDYCYVRVIDDVVYREISGKMMVSNNPNGASLLNVSTDLRLIGLSYVHDHFVLEERLRQTFSEVNFKPLPNANKIFIKPKRSILDSELVSKLELGPDDKSWKSSLTMIAIEFKIEYDWYYSHCDKIDLCTSTC